MLKHTIQISNKYWKLTFVNNRISVNIVIINNTGNKYDSLSMQETVSVSESSCGDISLETTCTIEPAGIMQHSVSGDFPEADAMTEITNKKKGNVRLCLLEVNSFFSFFLFQKFAFVFRTEIRFR